MTTSIQDLIIKNYDITVAEFLALSLEEQAALNARVYAEASSIERPALLISIQEVQDQIKVIIDGLKDEKDIYDHDSAAYERVDAEIDECKDILDQIETVGDNFNDQIADLSRLNLASTEDMLVNTDNYYDGELVTILLESGEGEILATDPPAVGDADGDTFNTYQDITYNAGMTATDSLTTNQNLFLQLGSNVVIQNIQKLDDGFTYITTYDTLADITVTFKGNFKEGNHLCIDADNMNYLTQTQMESFAEEIQAFTYLGDDPKSIFENLNPASIDAQLSAAESHDKVVSDLGSSLIYTSQTNDSAEIQEYAKQIIDTLYQKVFNEGMSSTEVLSNIINTDLVGLSPSQLSDALSLAVMSSAMNERVEVFQRLWNGSNPGLVEQVFVKDNFSVNEKMISLFLEKNSGGSGMFGGVEGLSKMFMTDSYGQTSIFDPILKEDPEGTLQAMELYKQMIANVSWATDDGTLDPYIEGLNATQGYTSQGISTMMTDEYMNQLSKAVGGGLYKKGDTSSEISGDILDTEFASSVTAGINYLVAQTETVSNYTLLSMKDMGGALETYLSVVVMANPDLAPHIGDIAAGIMWSLYKHAPDLFIAMCVARPSLLGSIHSCMQLSNDGNQWDELYKAANKIRKQVKNAVADIEANAQSYDSGSTTTK